MYILIIQFSRYNISLCLLTKQGVKFRLRINLACQFKKNLRKVLGGLGRTRTSDLTLIRRAL